MRAGGLESFEAEKSNCWNRTTEALASEAELPFSKQLQMI